MQKRGISRVSVKNFFCLIVPGNFVGELAVFQKVSCIDKVYSQKENITISVENCLSHSAEAIRGDFFCLSGKI